MSQATSSSGIMDIQSLLSRSTPSATRMTIQYLLSSPAPTANTMAIPSLLSNPTPSATTTQSRMSISAILSDQDPADNAPPRPENSCTRSSDAFVRQLTVNASPPSSNNSTQSYNASLKPLTKFEYFPILPIELRVAIWKASANSYPRVIEVFFHPILLQWTTAEQSYYGPPGLWGACRESRMVCEQLYHWLFPIVPSNWPQVYSPDFDLTRTIASYLMHPPIEFRKSCINPKVDTLYITAGIDNLKPKYTYEMTACQAIKYVENVSCEDWEFYGMRLEKWWLNPYGDPIFPSLKRFAVVLNDTCVACRISQPERMKRELICNSQGIRKRGRVELHDLPRPYDEWTQDDMARGIDEIYERDGFWKQVRSLDMQHPSRNGGEVNSLICFLCGQKVVSTID